MTIARDTRIVNRTADDSALAAEEGAAILDQQAGTFRRRETTVFGVLGPVVRHR